MRIKLLRDIGIKGEHCPTGSVLDVDKDLASYLIGNGSAVEAPEPLTVENAETVEAVTDPSAT